MGAVQTTVRARLMFAQVREDPRVDREICRRITGEGRVLMVASAGCTALSLLPLDRVQHIDAIDPNPAQVALCALQHRLLTHESQRRVRQLTGDVHADPDWRVARLSAHCRQLPDEHARYWAAYPELLRDLRQSGQFERLFALLRTGIEQLAIDRDLLRAFFDRRITGEQLIAKLDAAYWPVVFEQVFSDRLLRAMFGAPAIQHAPRDSYPRYFQRAFERLVSRPGAHRNYFLAQLLLGHGLPGPDGGPPWLRRDFAAARANAHKLALHRADLHSFLDAPQRYDAALLSNVFDWTDAAGTERICRRLLPALNPGALIVLRQINNRRPMPHILRERVDPLPIADRLLAAERSGFYSALRVWRVR